ncbi:hypothetical protein GQR58_010799 [Nymphon striatum]|nr:hypothetical protein GQR58_010799 [Nymphon striatum]
MVVKRYIGKPALWHGKALFELLINLKDFGIGRMVVRSNFERYKEPTYFIIKKVAPKMDPDNKLGSAWVDMVFRGVQEIRNVWKTDFKLIPKCEEEMYKINHVPDSEYLQKRILPQHIDVPPLMQRILMKENNSSVPKIPMKINSTINNRAKIAEDNEKPNVSPHIAIDYYLSNLETTEKQKTS